RDGSPGAVAPDRDAAVIKRHRLWTTSFFSLIFLAVVGGRLGYLQIYCHAALQERVEREKSRAFHAEDLDPRGAILDRNGAVLAMSIQGGACFADPHHAASPTETARLLSPLLHLPASAIAAKLAQRRRFVWLARRLD